MKKILLSLIIIGAVGAIAAGVTIAYFSDTETSVGNTFTAGTIDIAIDGENPWTGRFELADMKPCYTDYINFRIDNDLGDPNPVNIFKKITVTKEGTGAVSEPECIEESGTWNGDVCDGNDEKNDLSNYIIYDLNVEVYDGQDKIWWQTIYTDADGKVINDIYWNGSEYANNVFLGMIPAGGYMLVEQSYHLDPDVTNWAQGDIMTFDIEIVAEQLHGTAWLEDKDYADDTWKVGVFTPEQGVLTYKVKHSTFKFAFTGKAPLASEDYVLVAGPDVADPTIELGTGSTNGSGDIVINGDVEINSDLKDAKVWLVPATHWTGSAVTWDGWPNMNFLWETGLIWYEDTDL